MLSLLSEIGYNTAVVDGAIGKGFKWSAASNVALCGISIVFLMLVLLVICIAVFGKIMDKANGTTKPKAAKPPKPEKKVKPAPKVNNTNFSSESDDDVVAAIAAAVAYLYSGSDVTPVIRSIKRSDSKTQRSAWANAGIIQNTRAF